jgi:phospholipid/cholesterol/gamma-HCH transport system substrate-binding protein
MSKGRSEFKVGLVVFLAIAMSFTGIIWIKGYKFRQQFNTVKISFPDVGALRTGDPLAVSGVSMGKVKEIDLVSGKVVVTCSIDETVFLGEDATFTVKNIGLMGERFVAVYAGTLSTPLDTSIVHEGRFDTGIPEVMGMMGDMVSEVRELVRLIGSTVASPGTLNDFQETVSQLHDLSVSLNGLVDESRDDYRQSLHAIERASTSIDEFVQSSAPTADSAVKNFASASAKLDMLTDDLDTLSSSLQAFMDKLNSEEGSLGLLASDQTLYQDVKKAVREVDKLVADIRENPKKYLKMEFRLF